MKFIVVGLGNFGSALSLRLVEEGHEVIGIDTNHAHVNMLQDRLTHTLAVDTTNEMAIISLPISDTDYVVIGIGEDVGSSITTTALFKKHCVKAQIIGRAISPIHQTILEAMGIDIIINPEAEFAHQFANRLTVLGTIKSFALDDKHEIAEFKVPDTFIGKSVQEVDIVSKWKVSLITILSQTVKKNIIGNEIKEHKVSGVISGATVFKSMDTLVLFGAIKDLRAMMEELS